MQILGTFLMSAHLATAPVHALVQCAAASACAPAAHPHLALASEAGTMSLMALGLAGMGIAELRRRLPRRVAGKLVWTRDF